MNLTQIKDIAAIIQSAIVGIAVIIAGVWALFRFRALNEAAIARADLDRARLALEQKPTMNVRLIAQKLESTVAGEIRVVVTARIKNLGSGTEVIDWKETNLNWAEVVTVEPQRPRFGPVQVSRYADISDLISTSVEPGEEVEYQFLLALPQAGVYIFEFKAKCSPEFEVRDAEHHRRAGVQVKGIRLGTAIFFKARAED